LSGWSSSLISKIWLIACRSGISKISILKDIYLENRFVYNKLEAILFEEMRRIDLLWEIARHYFIPWTGGAFAPLGPFLCPTGKNGRLFIYLFI
jgi:hypothetical protein